MKKKPLLFRIRWVRIGCILCGILAAGAVGYSCYMDSLATELVEYRATVEEGDTIWSLCAKVASDEDEMEELVFRTMQENHIKDPAHLQPGQLIVIHVKPVKGGEEDEEENDRRLPVMPIRGDLPHPE